MSVKSFFKEHFVLVELAMKASINKTLYSDGNIESMSSTAGLLAYLHISCYHFSQTKHFAIVDALNPWIEYFLADHKRFSCSKTL